MTTGTGNFFFLGDHGFANEILVLFLCPLFCTFFCSPRRVWAKGTDRFYTPLMQKVNLYREKNLTVKVSCSPTRSLERLFFGGCNLLFNCETNLGDIAENLVTKLRKTLTLVATLIC